MKPKQTCKMLADIAMTLLLPVLMAYQLTGQLAHEIAGAAMLALFIAHHLLNRQWFKTLGRGKYNSLRSVQTAVDVLLLLCMLALMVSGIRLSRYVFAFLPGLGSISAARRVHLLASYWGFVLMSVHLGLHWGMVAGLLRRKADAHGPLAWAAGGLTALYGAYALWRERLWLYLFLQAEFVLFDPERPAALFFLDHLAMMGLFVFLAYEAAVFLRRRKETAV